MSSEPIAIQRFVAEAREHLAGMSSAMMELERGEGTPQAVIERILRAAHSIKGGAGFVGRGKIEQLAHALEEGLENIRDGRVTINPDVVDTLLAVLDRILAMVDDADHSDDADISGPLARLQPIIQAGAADGQIVHAPKATAAAVKPLAGALPPAAFALTPAVLSRWQPGSSWLYGVRLDWYECERGLNLGPHDVAEHVERAGSVLDSRTEVTAPPLSEGLPQSPLWWLAIMSSSLPPEQFTQRLAIPAAAVVVLREKAAGAAQSAAPPPKERAATAAGSTSLRVSVRLIDRLVELAGELSLVRNQTVRATDPANVALRRLTRRLDSVTNELQDAALRMRMQPVGTLFDRFPRLVRDLARQLGKQIELEITGSEVALDKAILEMLADPLTHLIRNCCDHGIEAPEQRAKAGKPSPGRIRLSARQERGQIVIEVRDDGRGIDRDAVKRKVIQQGIKRSDELERLNDRQIFDLILLSGFSTADRVTDLSGRGVGMDVVKTNLDQIGGVVEIDSSPGKGTVFNLRLPLTLAIMPCLLLVSGGRSYALPQRDVEEILLAGAHKRGLNTAIETAFNVPWANVEKVLPHVDLVLHDHKLTIPERHKKWTGVDNKRILENIKRAYETWPDKKFIARTPLIPGVNDDEEHIRAVLAFIKPYKNVVDYELLPYMRFGEGKYGFLGKVYEMQDFNPPAPEQLAKLRAIIDEAFGRAGMSARA